MGTDNSPAYRDGQAAKEARNAAREACPGFDVDTYDPSKYNGYTVMYDRGYESIELAPLHVCQQCRPAGAA